MKNKSCSKPAALSQCAAGHSACVQHFIDTGDPACIAKPYVVLDAEGRELQDYSDPVDASRALRTRPKGCKMVRRSDMRVLAWVPQARLRDRHDDS